MRVYFIFLVVTMQISVSCSAQSFNFSTGKILNVAGSADSLIIAAEISVQTSSSLNLFLRWKKIEENVVSGWQPSLCDNQHCFPTLPDSADLSGINASQGTNNHIILDLVPNGVGGTGQIKLLVYKISDPSDGDTITFNIDLSAPNAIKQFVNSTSILLFPNPANDQFTLEFDLPVQNKINGTIMDCHGQQVNKFILSEGISSQHLYVGDLAKGIYLVRLESERGEIIRKSFIKM